MSFFSGSSRRNHYKRGNYGSNHYQKKGILGSLFDIFSSGSHSGRHYNDYGRNYNQGFDRQNFNQQGVIQCGRCSSQIPAGSKFCLNCGEQVKTETFCGNCGEKMPPNAKFCLNCGSKINR